MKTSFTAWFVVIGSLAGLTAASADDGIAHNGPHSVPGVIRAVDFNDGPSLVAYYAATPGNQGGYSGYRSDTDVDIANGPGGPYVITTRADPPISDWLKYTIEVSQPGWYKVDYFARAMAPGFSRLVTLIDDRPLGRAGGLPVQDDFADVSSPIFHIGAGRHTLGILFRQAIALDRIEFSPVTAPPALTPRIVSPVEPSTEVIVADAVVTDTPYLADPTGARDSTQAFTDALQAVSAQGGGTVFAPAGIYRIDGTIAIPDSTTLRGADLPNPSDATQVGTLLLASSGEGDETAAPFISLSRLSCLRDLAVWYPSQGFTSGTVRPYPFTVSFDENAASALDIRLYNSYDGIAIRAAGNHHVSDIVGTVLHRGLTVGGGFEYSWLANVRFDNETWKAAPPIVSNAPSSQEDRLALDTYTTGNVTAIQLGTCDGYDAYGIRIRDANRDVVVEMLSDDPWPFYGLVSVIEGRIEEVDGFRLTDLHFLDSDDVPGTGNLRYDFAEIRGPANAANFARVQDAPFNAVGDGLADDTGAIQAALDQIGRSGGGTVYLSQGQYRVTRLTVPTGVELRGPLGGGGHHFSNVSTCTLLGYAGKDTSAPDSDPALLTLSPHSGIRGFDVVYPEQGYGSSEAPVLPYPFTIRGTAAGVWVENVAVANAYNLIDFASFRCDDHLVSGLEATALHTGILVGGGSEGGRLEEVLVTGGLYLGSSRLSGPLLYGTDPLAAYMRGNAVPFVFGSCTGENTFGLDSFDVKIGWWMLADGGGCTDSTFWLSSSDTSTEFGYRFEGGNNLRFVGAAAGGSGGASFVSSSSFTGSVDVYGTMSWGNARDRELSGGAFRFHDEKGLTLGKTATASSNAFGDGSPSSAVDGSEFTKWVSASGGANWLTVDLDQPSEIDRWVVRHAGTNAEPDELNTSDFTLQVSDDGVTFSDADPVTGNGNRLTDRPAAARGRFVRLLVSQGTQAGGDGRARIYEFQAHGNEGWQFTNDAEGWAPSADISAFEVSDGKLAISSSGSQPTITSPDNLNITTSKFAALRVRMRNGGAPTSAKLSFTTNADPNFSEAKSEMVSTVESSPEYVTYYFDLSANTGWTGTLRQLRLTPIQAPGDVSIDSIALGDGDPNRRILVRPHSPPRGPQIVER